jgi:prepilin-type N-terminal cleavage/methylation domain-containing protein
MRNLRRAFTLVELLVVIGIIALLIGIGTPAIQGARNAAKNTGTANRFKDITQACELFNNDYQRYPQSGGENPFRPAGSAHYLSGAQWLAMQLSGVDGLGYIDVNTTDRRAEGGGNPNTIDHIDRAAWYAPATEGRFRSLRNAPYLQADSSWFETPQREMELEGGNFDLSPQSLAANVGGSGDDLRNYRLPYYEDYFNRPILYYAANIGALSPFSTGNGRPSPQDMGSGATSSPAGLYDQTDNAAWTGSDANQGVANRVDRGTAFGKPREPDGFAGHKIRRLGYTRGSVERPAPETFAGFVYDQDVFNQTAGSGRAGRVVPKNPDRFLLISAGKDGLYGTNDDVVNFGR